MLLIPKTCFLYWDGSPFALLNYLSIKSFRDFHPDWNIKMYMPLHRTKSISWKTHEQKLPYNGPDYFSELSNLNVEIIKIDFKSIGFINEASEVIKSDYLRYWLLYTYGGIWSDCDIIYIKSLNDVFKDNKTDAIICCQKNPSTHVIEGYPVGFLAASKNHPLFHDILTQCQKYYDPLRYESLGSILFVRLFPNPLSIKSIYPNNNILIMDKWYYLPYNWNQLHLLYDSPYDPCIFETHSCIFGIHWFNGAKRTKEFLNTFSVNSKNDIININTAIHHFISNVIS